MIKLIAGNEVISSLRDPESCEYIFDERLEKYELRRGVVLEDNGYHADGDVLVLTCIFAEADYQRLMNVWQSRSKVTFEDESGQQHADKLLVFRSVRYVGKFPDYRELKFELWNWQPMEADF